MNRLSRIARSELVLALWWITSRAISNRIYICISSERRSASVGLQGPCHVCLDSVYIWNIYVSVRAYSPHNLHHTGHIENDKQRIVGFQSVAFPLLLLGLGWFYGQRSRVGQLSVIEYFCDLILHSLAYKFTVVINTRRIHYPNIHLDNGIMVLCKTNSKRS